MKCVICEQDFKPGELIIIPKQDGVYWGKVHDGCIETTRRTYFLNCEGTRFFMYSSDKHVLYMMGEITHKELLDDPATFAPTRALQPEKGDNRAEHQANPVIPLNGKYPKWMIGQLIVAGYNLEKQQPIMRECTADDIHPGCTCENLGASMFCMTGHLLECHAGQTCRQANCNYLSRYDEEEFPPYYDSQGNEHQEY